jgi:outer membrane protein OmpA-like peptidoglycan-associated protein
MNQIHRRFPRAVLIQVAALLVAAGGLARAADPPAAPDTSAVMTDEQIESALKPAKTRGLTLRGLKRTQSAESMAAVNLNIPFEYNSSQLKPEASAQLKQLKSALTRDSLRNDRFMVAGHTDSKGNPQYNKQLSLRRAETVKRYLISNGIGAGRMDTVGVGSEQPLTPDRPDDAQNRRVEIRDLGEAPAGH